MSIYNYDYNKSDFNQFIQVGNINSLKVDENGLLKEKTIKDKARELLNPANKKKEQEKIKNKILSLTRSIQNSNTLSDEDKVEHIAAIFKKIIPLKDSDFVIELSQQTELLRKSLENRLSPQLKELREIKKQYKEDLKSASSLTRDQLSKNLEQTKLAIKIAKAHLGLELGLKLKANKGATGTVLVKDLKGQYIGVFKPTNQHIPAATKIKNLFKAKFGGQLFYLDNKSDAQSKAEVAAYKLDRHFGFNLSPASDFIQLDNKTGTFQQFLKNYGEVKAYLDPESGKIKDSSRQEDKIHSSDSPGVDSLDLVKSSYSQEQINAFQKMVVFDYFIGNLDRHEENWFVKLYQENGQKGADFSDLKVIDNANSFLRKNPGAKGRVKNQYKWKNLEIAKEPFSEETKNFIKKNLTIENLLSFKQELRSFDKNFLTPEMEKRLDERFAVLVKLAQMEGMAPSSLGDIVSDADIKKMME